MTQQDMQAHSEREARLMRQAYESGRRAGLAVVPQVQARPAAPDARRLAASSAATAIVSVLVWPLGFVAILLAWKATKRGMGLDWPEAAWAVGGATLGTMTAALTAGIVGALIAQAIG